jgi:DNA processing protein
MKGNLHLTRKRGVAIVGARNASANGRRFARDIAWRWAGMIFSSSPAWRAASTRSIPKKTAPCRKSIVERGVLLAEMPIGIEPQARHFPRRNRIIFGASLGVLVVEAAERSGSLITARFALEQGREVFAVPGSPLDPRCKGTNRLIRDGATLVESVDDILGELKVQLAAPLAERRKPTFSVVPAPELNESELEKARKNILALLSPTPVPVDELIRECQLSPAIVLTVVLELELASRIERQPGNTLNLL